MVPTGSDPTSRKALALSTAVLIAGGPPEGGHSVRHPYGCVRQPCAYQTSFAVPNLLREDKRIPISSVVLSSQRVSLGDALFNVQQKISAEAANPLVSDGQKLIPSVTRVFSKSREMYVFLQAYQRGATATQPLVAFVSFFRGEEKAFETSPLPVTEGLDAKSKAVPLRFSLSLDGLPTGRYDCQISVLDPTGQRAAFWRAPVVLVP